VSGVEGVGRGLVMDLGFVAWGGGGGKNNCKGRRAAKLGTSVNFNKLLFSLQGLPTFRQRGVGWLPATPLSNGYSWIHHWRGKKRRRPEIQRERKIVWQLFNIFVMTTFQST